jgi:iron complex transport system ATP-binding protein
VTGSLRTQRLTLAYHDVAVVRELDLEIPPRRITAVVGANACGKSTLLRGLARLMRPRGGAVLLDGEAIARLPTRMVARQIGLLPQEPTAPQGITVEDLVARGRYPHQRFLQQWSAQDQERVEWALEATGVGDLRDRSVDELSGGQRQRTWISMALAQDTEILLLDEPTSHLDLAHQLEVLDLLADLNERDGRTIVLVLHDLNEACRYADWLVAMAGGGIYAQGPPEQVVDAAMVEAVYGVEAEVVAHPVAGTPLCLPLGRRVRARA